MRTEYRRDIRRMRTLLLALPLLAGMTGCTGPEFTSYAVLERLRILGLHVDHPEICPFGPSQCPEGTHQDEVRIAILAADQAGIVADGLHPDGPYLRGGHDLEWALCDFSFRGVTVESPDCTLDDHLLLETREPWFRLTRDEILESVMRALEQEPNPGPGNGFEDQAMEETFSFHQILATSIASTTEREWGVKSVVLSNRTRDLVNVNPVLESVTLEGVEVHPGEEPFAQVETGHAYRVEWTVPEEHWQRYEAHTTSGIVMKKELYNLSFWCTAGSFDNHEPVNLWMEDEEENELYWRPPLEVPEEGWEVTLVFNLWDARGGSTWTWGKVRVVRGDAVMPR